MIKLFDILLVCVLVMYNIGSWIFTIILYSCDYTINMYMYVYFTQYFCDDIKIVENKNQSFTSYVSFYWFTWPTGWWIAMDLYLLSPCQTALMLSIHCSIFSFLWFRILWIIFGPFYLTWPKGSHEILSSLCVSSFSSLNFYILIFSEIIWPIGIRLVGLFIARFSTKAMYFVQIRNPPQKKKRHDGDKYAVSI